VSVPDIKRYLLFATLVTPVTGWFPGAAGVATVPGRDSQLENLLEENPLRVSHSHQQYVVE
jgi:hypothetical protein